MAPPPNTGEDVEKMVMHLLLVGTLNGTATLEYSLTVSYNQEAKAGKSGVQGPSWLFKRSLRLVWAT